jgi:hypothetical protein
MSKAELLTRSGHNNFKTRKTHTLYRAERETHIPSKARRQMPVVWLQNHRRNIREGKEEEGKR